MTRKGLLAEVVGLVAVSYEHAVLCAPAELKAGNTRRESFAGQENGFTEVIGQGDMLAGRTCRAGENNGRTYRAGRYERRQNLQGRRKVWQGLQGRAIRAPAESAWQDKRVASVPTNGSTLQALETQMHGKMSLVPGHQQYLWPS